MAPGYVAPAMILSQSCDLDFRKHVQIAPVRPSTKIQNQETLENLRQGEIGYYYFLPATDNFPESFADFTHITSIDASYLRIDQVKVRLSTRGNADFMNFLSDYFAKPFGWNRRDAVAEAGNYCCAHCFFTAATISKQAIQPGANSPTAPAVEKTPFGSKCRRRYRPFQATPRSEERAKIKGKPA
jgi:hypothetical protein